MLKEFLDNGVTEQELQRVKAEYFADFIKGMERIGGFGGKSGVLVQDAAYMVGVPNVAPETPPLRKNPVFLYFQDYFQRPNPFRPDVAVDITTVFDKKVYAMAAHESQYFEWLPWIGGYLNEVPTSKAEWLPWLTKRLTRRTTPEMLQSIEKWYGKEHVAKVKNVEAFEICEYGAQPTAEEIKRLFPMLGK